MVCWRKEALSGRYFMYSTGRASLKPIARMLMKSDAGSTSLKTMVEGFGALTPGKGVPCS